MVFSRKRKGGRRGRSSNVNIATFMDGRCRKWPWNYFFRIAYFWAHCYGWICLCKYYEHAAIISLSFQIYYYADAQTTHTVYPDGLEVLQFPNNQIGMQELINVNCMCRFICISVFVLLESVVWILTPADWVFSCHFTLSLHFTFSIFHHFTPTMQI